MRLTEEATRRFEGAFYGVDGLGTASGPHLPFFVMIISVPTELNCFHNDAFSSSILTSAFWVLAAASLETGEGATNLEGKALVDTSQVVGYSGTGAGACRSVYKDPRKVVQTSNQLHLEKKKIWIPTPGIGT